MRIRHNLSAMYTYRMGIKNRAILAKRLEKLSSGLRINRAADDAAGLALSEKMRAQLRGLETAGKNALDAISLLQTAEGALDETHNMLGRMVELAEQAANGVYDDTTIRTDGDGNLVLPNLSDGNHIIKLEHDGKDYEGTVTVGGGNVTVDIWEVLPPGPVEGAIRFQIGASAGEILDFVVRDMDCAGIGIDGLSVATQHQAAAALDGIKNAIGIVSTQRGYIGGLHNRLEHTVNSLNVTAENITAAESRIRDADMATEMMGYVKQNILSEAAQAMLAQANTLPNELLRLLR